jgi:hypothetical protein
MSLAQLQQDRADRARRRRALLVAEMAAVVTEPEPYAVAPLGDHWTVVSPDAESVVTPTDWSLVEAVAAAGWLNRGLSAPNQFAWAEVA